MPRAEWTGGVKPLTGSYDYYWAGDVFRISLDRPVGYGGERRKTFLVYNDTPEWGRWKLVRN